MKTKLSYIHRFNNYSLCFFFFFLFRNAKLCSKEVPGSEDCIRDFQSQRRMSLCTFFKLSLDFPEQLISYDFYFLPSAEREESKAYWVRGPEQSTSITGYLLCARGW